MLPLLVAILAKEAKDEEAIKKVVSSILGCFFMKKTKRDKNVNRSWKKSYAKQALTSGSA